MFYLLIMGLFSLIFCHNSYSQASLFDGVEELHNQQSEKNNHLIISTDLSLDLNDSSIKIIKSSLPEYRNTSGKKTLVVNISKQAFGAYDSSGELVRTGRVSTAKRGYSTKRGTFTNLQKRGGAGCWSSKYKVGIPYCIFYFRGFALHGYHDVPNYPASRGCIRLEVENARWLHNQFIDRDTVLIVK